MKKSRKYYRIQWLLRGGIGASLTGFGISAIVECGFLKHEGSEFLNWFSMGTLALIVFMSGISLLIDAVRFRIKMDN